MNFQPLPVFLLALCCFVLSPDAGAQSAEGGDDPGFFQRFIAIFKEQPTRKLTEQDSLRENWKAEPGLTERYPRAYQLIHQKQQDYYQSLADSSHTRWDEISDLEHAVYRSPDGDTTVLAKNVRVFGWHPHWMNQAYESYHYKKLSHVSLFSYSVNVNGTATCENPGILDQWASDDFKLVERAHADNCKVMLTMTSFGYAKNQALLSDFERQEDLIDDLVKQMIRVNADGIDVDFELIPTNFEKQLSSFLLRLHDRLAKGGDRYELSVVLPKINGTTDGERVYNIKHLQQFVDFFTLTAYDFRTASSPAGPISPLYNADGKRRSFGSIEDVVYNYLEDGLDRKKLLLGLPHYGGQWTTHFRADGTDSVIFRQPPYANVLRDNRRNGPPERHRIGAASYRTTSPSELDGFVRKEQETWYEDSITMEEKYDWVLKEGLGGVGIWALGYDGSRTELWGLINEKFAPVNDTIVHYQPAQSAWSAPLVLLRYGNLFGVSGLFLFAFLTVGFVVALFDWRVRDVFFRHKTLRVLYIVASFALVTATAAVVLFLRADALAKLEVRWLALGMLVVGLIFGSLLMKGIGGWFQRRRGATP